MNIKKFTSNCEDGSFRDNRVLIGSDAKVGARVGHSDVRNDQDALSVVPGAGQRKGISSLLLPRQPNWSLSKIKIFINSERVIFQRALTLLLSERPEHLNLTSEPTCTIWMDGSEIEMEMVAGGLGPPAVGGAPGAPESASGKNQS
jgi:hypothetical protein